MRPRTTNRISYLLDVCRGKQVLHVGCADAPDTKRKLDDGTLLYPMIEKVAALQYGIDLSCDGIQMLKKRGYNNVAVADVEEIESQNPFAQIDFDVVLAGEILEHLSNPGLFLDGVRPLLKRPSSRLVLTTVNAYCAYRFLYTLLTTREAVNTDHVYYFSRSTLTELVTRHRYEVEDFRFYSADEYEKDLNRGRTRILWWADRFASWFHPTLGDGLVVTCKVSTAWDTEVPRHF